MDFEISNLCPSVSNTDCFTGNTQKGVKHRSSYGYLVYLLKKKCTFFFFFFF